MKWALGKDYDVLLAGDRIGALDEFNLKRPAVVILDLGLPPCPNQRMKAWPFFPISLA